MATASLLFSSRHGLVLANMTRDQVKDILDRVLNWPPSPDQAAVPSPLVSMPCQGSTWKLCGALPSRWSRHIVV
jgi:hypothetical protein